uniref:CSON010994 protein n=1 Tax=Culicoides sonorensis TaxID=179676 RepID=A0A336M2V9_CULSO
MPPQIKQLFASSSVKNTLTDRMQSRDHPLNRSTRPLLERKHFAPQPPKRKSPERKMYGFNDFNSIPRQYDSLNSRVNMYGDNDFVFSDEPKYKNQINDSDSESSDFETPKAIRKNDVLKCKDFSWKPMSPPLPPHRQIITADNEGPFVFGVHSQNSFLPAYNNNKNNNIKSIKNGSVIPTSYTTNGKLIDTSPNTSQSQSETSPNSKAVNKERRWLLLSKRNKRRQSKADKKEKDENKRRSCKSPGIKCVVVGDGTAGKTNLIQSYLLDSYVHDSSYVPTAFDKYNVEVQVDGKPLNVTVCDTAGQDVLDPLRQLCYPNTDVFLLCFSVVKPDTFKSIETKWVPELSKNNCSLLLIGTHSDLRDDAKTIQALQVNFFDIKLFSFNNILIHLFCVICYQAAGEKPISVSDAWDLARRIGAKYFETSVYNKEKIKEVFDTVIWDALQAQRKRPPFWKRLLCLT